MPNHFHGIVVIKPVGAGTIPGNKSGNKWLAPVSAPVSLGEAVGGCRDEKPSDTWLHP